MHGTTSLPAQRCSSLHREACWGSAPGKCLREVESAAQSQGRGSFRVRCEMGTRDFVGCVRGPALGKAPLRDDHDGRRNAPTCGELGPTLGRGPRLRAKLARCRPTRGEIGQSSNSAKATDWLETSRSASSRQSAPVWHRSSPKSELVAPIPERFSLWTQGRSRAPRTVDGQIAPNRFFGCVWRLWSGRPLQEVAPRGRAWPVRSREHGALGVGTWRRGALWWQSEAQFRVRVTPGASGRSAKGVYRIMSPGSTDSHDFERHNGWGGVMSATTRHPRGTSSPLALLASRSTDAGRTFAHSPNSDRELLASVRAQLRRHPRLSLYDFGFSEIAPHGGHRRRCGS